MLFNSTEFIFYFLPSLIAVFFFSSLFNKHRLEKFILLVFSIGFYSYWDVSFTYILAFSVIVNYFISKKIISTDRKLSRHTFLILGIIFNLTLLIHYKYTDFILSNMSYIIGFEYQLKNTVLPLAISFFTFQQIAYLVDCYNDRNIRYDFFNYSLFVIFFPQLIAGPIVHHSEVMPQIEKLRKLKLENLMRGWHVFLIGLVKKVVFADYLAVIANKGFASPETLTFFDSWFTSLSYTLQLYFDFSGYSDMAIGLALMFNISIPNNFNSPYKAVSIQDFWRRWHMTLSRWLRDYVYIPLGGNRKNFNRTNLNIFTTFLIGGIWHGAGWTFIIWGCLHGLANMVQRFWQKSKFKEMPNWLAIFVTFNFVNIAWVFFRAADVKSALLVLRTMFYPEKIVLPVRLQSLGSFLPNVSYGHHSPTTDVNTLSALAIIILLAACFYVKNSIQLRESFNTDWRTAIFMALATISLLFINNASEFIYFQF